MNVMYMESIFVSVVLLFLLIIFSGICAICFIHGRNQRKILEMKLKHEEDMERMAWMEKKEWEEMVAENAKKSDEIRKEYEGMKEKVDNLWDKRDQTPQIDLNRFALVHLLLTGSKEAITPEILKREVEKVKMAYEQIKDYIK